MSNKSNKKQKNYNYRNKDKSKASHRIGSNHP